MAALCAGAAGMVLIAAIALNEGALRAENNLPTDDAFGPFAFGIVMAFAACVLGVRSVRRLGTGRSLGPAIVLSAAASATAIIGAVVAIGEPAAFNAGYGCLGSSAVWLAVATRPTPATCGYLIPQADTSLFLPAAYAGFGAAVLGAACAALMLRGRARRST